MAGTDQKEKCLPDAGARAGEYKRGDHSRDMWQAVVSPGPWQELALSRVCVIDGYKMVLPVHWCH